ncbi:hypothetical protein EDB89DRAFT_1906521 [Lactarius sanguifluus]|nr:hypothetical protein EDB89DRAFT_1906521 [Lactarius sanguifluus]
MVGLVSQVVEVGGGGGRGADRVVGAMNSDVAGRGGDGVGSAEAASAAAVSTGGLCSQAPRGGVGGGCGGGSVEGVATRVVAVAGNGDDWYTDEREWEQRQLKIKKQKKKKKLILGEPTSPGASTGVGGGCGGNGGDLYVHEGRRGQQRRQLEIKRRKKKKNLILGCATYRVCYTQGAGGATGVGGGGSGCDGNGGDLYVHKGKRGDVDVLGRCTGSWCAPRDGVEATVAATGLVHMGWSRGGSDEGWCHRQRDITRVRMRGGRMTAGGWLACVYDACEGDCNTRSIVQHSQLVTKLHESVRLKRCGDERGKDHVAKTTAWEKFFPCSTGNLRKCATCYMSTATVVTATSPHAHTGHIPSLLPPTPVAATAASTPRQFPVHPPSPDINVAPASPRARKATPSLQPPLPSPVPVGAPSTPQLPHRFLTHGQDAANDALGRCPVHQDTMLSFPHRSLQHRAGKTPPSLICRDDTMARDDMSRCDNLTTCKNRTGYEHSTPALWHSREAMTPTWSGDTTTSMGRGKDTTPASEATTPTAQRHRREATTLTQPASPATSLWR